MKLAEITSKSRKAIKRLQTLYIDYALDPTQYQKLVNALTSARKTADSDILQEVAHINAKLQFDLIRFLSNH